ncbi:MAG: hypothetical protein WAV45_09615 [Propionibacteriaceae bacterium]|jgi:hypothetical protein
MTFLLEGASKLDPLSVGLTALVLLLALLFAVMSMGSTRPHA